MEDSRTRQLNDRPAALDAKYDPKEFLNSKTEEMIREIQRERGLEAGDRALKGAIGREVNSPERVADYM